MTKIENLKVKYHDRDVGTLTLTPDNRLCAFEYDKGWLVDGFSISPFELPLKSGVFIAKGEPFNGNFGIFEDSLPDGYGRYLLHKTLLREGINSFSLSSLDFLSIIGSNGMGALTYVPETQIMRNPDFDDFDRLQAIALEVLREKQDSDAAWLLHNSGNSGGARPKAVYSDYEGHWLVKFRHTYDPIDMGLKEFTYNQAAKNCGINVPDFKIINGKYFACRRFDIDRQGERVHVATAGALLGLSLSMPLLDYGNLLALTGFLTQSPQEVEEMFRRMVFNYLTDNKDDHCKNFSFLIRKNNQNKWRWFLSPAYDLTLCTEGYNGEHATSVNGTGKPGLQDFVDVGIKAKMAKSRCLELIEQVKENCGCLLRYDI